MKLSVFLINFSHESNKTVGTWYQQTVTGTFDVEKGVRNTIINVVGMFWQLVINRQGKKRNANVKGKVVKVHRRKKCL